MTLRFVPVVVLCVSLLGLVLFALNIELFLGDPTAIIPPGVLGASVLLSLWMYSETPRINS